MVFDWKKLKTPFFVLAPMYDVTDSVFRRIIAQCAPPDVFFTEFVSVDGMAHPASRERMVEYYLRFSPQEQPLIAQVWGGNPEKFVSAAQTIASLGFSGIDINMGCPDKKVLKAGAGGALIEDSVRAKEIIAATKEGAGDLPVSVKTRIGLTSDTAEKWIQELCNARPAAITVHARTVKNMSRVPADWDAIARAFAVAAPFGIPIIGNGDIKSREDGIAKAAATGASGVMVGRGVLGNYWFFSGTRSVSSLPLAEKLRMVARHAALFEQEYVIKGLKKFYMMRKHMAAYAAGFPGARELRGRLMQAQNAAEVSRLIEEEIAGSHFGV